MRNRLCELVLGPNRGNKARKLTRRRTTCLSFTINPNTLTSSLIQTISTMSRPATHPGNANKHPGDIVHNANRQQRPKEEIAAEKKRKHDEKVAKSSAAEQARIKTARQKDVMAIEQQVELAGPPKLIRPRPRPCIPAKNAWNLRLI